MTVLYRYRWVEELASERVFVWVKWTHERLPVDVLESHVSSRVHGLTHVVDMIFRQCHRQASHHTTEQTVDVMSLEVLR